MVGHTGNYTCNATLTNQSKIKGTPICHKGGFTGDIEFSDVEPVLESCIKEVINSMPANRG